jgi:glycolate oxidase iron-sulfur subunit
VRALLRPEILDTRDGSEAESILRSCVHCGFCNATCPTYQLLGDERDGPRGRIYQIKSLLEGDAITAETAGHLDRCLGCRACETTCPSGVQYGRLLDYARPLVDAAVPRPAPERARRWLFRRLIPSTLFPVFLALGRGLRPLLPAALARLVPVRRPAAPWPEPVHATRYVALEGCVQEAARPSINAAAARVLDRRGISLFRVADGGCCGALAYHLGAHEEARDCARRNIDAWWPQLRDGAEGIFSASSGCSPMLKDYGELLRDDPAYAERARLVAARVRDATELVTPALAAQPGALAPAVAVQAPCALQHGLRGSGRMEAALAAAGCAVRTPADSHLCCGSAGAYSLLQPALAGQLLERKLDSLMVTQPEVIATSNIGCMLHLEKRARVPVRHWLEIVDGQQSGTGTT